MFRRALWAGRRRRALWVVRGWVVFVVGGREREGGRGDRGVVRCGMRMMRRVIMCISSFF